MKNPVVKVASLFAAALVSWGGAYADLTDLQWTYSAMDAAGSPLSTQGKRVFAYCGGANGERVSVNGVQFTAVNKIAEPPTGTALLFRTSPKLSYEKPDAGGSDFGSEGVSDAGYAKLLKGGWWKDQSGTYEFTVEGLVPEHTYQVQLVMHSGSASTTVAGMNAAEGEYIACGGTGWTYGGVMTGVFTAGESSCTFGVNYLTGSKAYLNAVQMRDLSESGPDVDEVILGSLSASVDGSSVAVSLAGVVMGTDAAGVAANSYSVTYSVDGAAPVAGPQNVTTATTSFNLTDVADGTHTCQVTITTDKGTTATKTVEFVVNTSMVWTAEAMGSDPDAVRTNGKLVFAYCGGTAAEQCQLVSVNGVQFTAVNKLDSIPDALKPFPMSISPTMYMDASGQGTEGLSESNPGYASLLSKGWWLNKGGEYTIKLKDLTPGDQYLVQLFVHRKDATFTVSVVGNSSAVINASSKAGSSWTYGGTLVGTFTPVESTHSFVIAYDGESKAQINAIQVRNLSQSGPEVRNPVIGSASAAVNGATATVSLAGIVKGTDDEGADAMSYAVSYKLDGGAAVTALENQIDSEVSFPIANLGDGMHTCEVTITTDKGKTAVRTVSFAVAASLRWEAAPMSATGDTIVTKGELQYAYCGGTNALVTVNGVEFTGIHKPSSLNAASFSVSPSMAYEFVGTAGTEGVVDADYASLLSSGWWKDASGDVEYTLKDLTPGRQYLVQLIVHNHDASNTVCPAGQAQNSITQGGAGWTYGGSLVGRFTASASTYSFTLNYSGSRSERLNAIQVRLIRSGFALRLR